MTRDIDVVVDVGTNQVDTLLRAFRDDYYFDAEAAARAVAERRLVNAVHESTLVKVDLVSFRADWVDDGKGFVVNRSDTVTSVVLFDRFWINGQTP